MSKTDILFQPFKLKTLERPNRIVMAPMTRSKAPYGIPGAANAQYYRKRAEGGVGLILSEGTVINRLSSRNEPGIPFFHGAAVLKGWKAVVDAVHEARAAKWVCSFGIPVQPVPSPDGSLKTRSKARPACLPPTSRAATP